MSRIDHIINRRQEGPRKIRPGQKMTPVFDKSTGKVELRVLPFHNQGDGWWKVRFADLVERRIVTDREWGHSTITYTPRPPRNVKPKQPPSEYMRPVMAVRPDGMSRQVQRQLYRRACKAMGVPFRGPVQE